MEGPDEEVTVDFGREGSEKGVNLEW